jgi:Secretion system C-terminal sorting domain
MMNKFVFLLISIFTVFFLNAQEVVNPIVKPLDDSSIKRLISLDSSIIYISDTLELPFYDDFSVDHFQKYNATFNNENTTSSLFYKYVNKSNNQPVDSKLKYTLEETFQYKFDSITRKSSKLKNVPVKLFSYDLTKYPFDYSEVSAYPSFSTFDTIGIPNSIDTIFSDNVLIQDSIRLFFNKINNKFSYWLDSNAYRNDWYAVNPWSLGVVTFDGLNSNGYPYSINSSARGYGDYLTSKPIDLSTVEKKDSVYFSFLYQPKGNGDAPENISTGTLLQHDSLCLQFYNNNLKKWISIWATTPESDYTKFKIQSQTFTKVHIPLKDTNFFKKGFQFRFVNYGDLSGDLDHFHIDYVKLRKFSGVSDTNFQDFAMMYPVNNLLKKYQSIPWEHFLKASNDILNDSVRVMVRNGSLNAQNTLAGTVKILENGNEIAQSFLNPALLPGNNFNYLAQSTNISYHDFPRKINWKKNKTIDSAAYTIKVAVPAPFTNDPINDTSYSKLEFKDYYAFDDGTAELAYGLKSNQAETAYQFTVYEPDTLIGLSICFVPTVEDKSAKNFSIVVRENNNGIPGNILYEDGNLNLRTVRYGKSRNEFKSFYFIDFKGVNIKDNFFIGLRQYDQEWLNIGLDVNTNSLSNLFFTTGENQWQKSSLGINGSLMMRPIFKSRYNKSLSFSDNLLKNKMIIYPNPTAVSFQLDNSLISNYFDILDVNGRVLSSFQYLGNPIDVSFLNNGVYIVREGKSGATYKLIKN